MLRTGGQWKAVPPAYGSGSMCHRRFQQWIADGPWERLWRDQVERSDREHGIGWDWPVAESATVPSPLGGEETGPAPTNRGKLGPKRHVLSDRRGAPLSTVISATNRTDMELAAAPLNRIVVPRPTPTPAHPQHLCRDTGFDYPETRAAAEARGYRVHTAHQRQPGEAPLPPAPRFGIGS